VLVSDFSKHETKKKKNWQRLVFNQKLQEFVKKLKKNIHFNFPKMFERLPLVTPLWQAPALTSNVRLGHKLRL
jgi:hypothetical protein